jgi:hypothetical protein
MIDLVLMNMLGHGENTYDLLFCACCYGKVSVRAHFRNKVAP